MNRRKKNERERKRKSIHAQMYFSFANFLRGDDGKRERKSLGERRGATDTRLTTILEAITEKQTHPPDLREAVKN